MTVTHLGSMHRYSLVPRLGLVNSQDNESLFEGGVNIRVLIRHCHLLDTIKLFHNGGIEFRHFSDSWGVGNNFARILKTVNVHYDTRFNVHPGKQERKTNRCYTKTTHIILLIFYNADPKWSSGIIKKLHVLCKMSTRKEYELHRRCNRHVHTHTLNLSPPSLPPSPSPPSLPSLPPSLMCHSIIYNNWHCTRMYNWPFIIYL